MAIIQRIREKGAWLITGALGLALAVFVVEEGLRKNSSSNSSSNVGSINGVDINRTEFDAKVEQASKNNPQGRDGVVNQIWNQEVNRILLEQQFDKIGLACTDKQLSEELFKPNSPLMNEFRDPKTGIADVERARTTFAQFKKQAKDEDKKNFYEGAVVPLILQTKYGKYNNLLSKAAYAPKWLVEKQQADANVFSTVSYVAVPYSTIADSTVKVSDDEIVAYGKKHSKIYEKDEETRSFSAVSFDANPSSADSASAKDRVETKRADFTNESNPEMFFAKNVSELKYFNGYISGKNIQQRIKDTLFKLPVGGVFGPYLDGNNYVLAKMVGIKAMPDSAKVRHILIKTTDRDQRTGQEYVIRDDSSAKHILDTIVMKINSGKSFDSLCKAQSEDDGSKEKGGVYDYFPSGNMVAAFNDFAFTQGVGSKGIVKTEFGYHYIEVLGQKGSNTAYKIAYFAKPITLSNETDNAAKTAATTFLQSVKTKKEFDEAAAKLQKQPIVSDNIKQDDYNIGMLGNNRSLVKWIYKNGVGDITDQTYSINNKYIVGIVTAVNPKGVPSAASLRPQVEMLVKNEKKAKQIIDKMKGNTLETMASSVGNNAQVSRIDTLLASNTFNPILGNDYKFAGAAFNAGNKGKITDVVAGQTGVFALRVENIGAKSGAPADVNAIKNMLTSSIKSAANIVGGVLLKKSASIKDNRFDLY